MDTRTHASRIRYDHRQVGWPLLLGLLGSLALAALVVGWSTSTPWPALLHPVPAGVLLLLLAVALIFGVLRTRITDRSLEIRFGAGWPRKVIPLERIAGVRVVRNRWYYGWGIRITPHGWLWNASGLDAVELAFHDGKRFRVGTDDPLGLTEALLDVLEGLAPEDGPEDGQEDGQEDGKVR